MFGSAWGPQADTSQNTLVGATGTGAILVQVRYQPGAAGADIA